MLFSLYQCGDRKQTLNLPQGTTKTEGDRLQKRLSEIIAPFVVYHHPFLMEHIVIEDLTKIIDQYLDRRGDFIRFTSIKAEECTRAIRIRSYSPSLSTIQGYQATTTTQNST